MRTSLLILSICAFAFGQIGCGKSNANRAQLPQALPKQTKTTKTTKQKPKHASTDTPKEKSRIIANVDNLNLATTVVLSGSTKAARSTQLAPRLSGMVSKIYFKEGDVVEKNARLVQIDPTDYRIALKQAQAAKNTALAQLEAIKIEWKRLKGLVAAKAIASGKYDTVNSKFKVAQAGLAQAEVGVLAARNALAKTTIRAPFKSVVTAKLTEIGVYATMMPPTPLVKLEEINPIEIVLQVPENQVAKVKKGSEVDLNISAIKYKTRAIIDRIVPSLNARTRSLSVFITLKNNDHLIRPGMYVEATLLRSVK